MSAEIMSVSELLGKRLSVPGYQRPYRWSTRSVADLLADIDAAISDSKEYADFKYRIGTVILHDNVWDGCFDIVDGQQRVLSLVLLLLALDEGASPYILEASSFSNRESQRNIHANYAFIEDWVGYQPRGWREEAKTALSETIEAVVVVVDEIEEAFQLFDSQNTRGKSLDPHDLLKAYHLRAMRDRPCEMRHAVTRWEGSSPSDIRDIFARYLFPISQWSQKRKVKPFSVKDIGAYKGIDDASGYSYADRAKRAAPCFQIGEPFIEGKDFFLMVEHYLRLKREVETELRENTEFAKMREVHDKAAGASVGFRYADELFMCAVLAYYDRFRNFDKRAIGKVFTWAFMVRVKMQSLGFASVNKYAIGESSRWDASGISLFFEIANARRHSDIANLVIRVGDKPADCSDERAELWEALRDVARGEEHE